MTNPSPTNTVTDATVALGNDYLSVSSNGKAAYTTVTRSDGGKVGLVQSVNWSIGVKDQVARCVIETVASPADLKALLSDTTFLVRPAPDYHPLRYIFTYYSTKIHLWVSNLRARF